jgi:hypothetical protein
MQTVSPMNLMTSGRECLVAHGARKRPLGVARLSGLGYREFIPTGSPRTRAAFPQALKALVGSVAVL